MQDLNAFGPGYDWAINMAIYSVIDTETTSANPTEAQIIEIARVDVLESGGMLRRHSTLVRPDIPIPPSSSAVHGIVDDDVVCAPDFETIEHVFSRTVNVFVAHNAIYDYTVTKFTHRPWLCTYRLAMHLYPEFDSHSLQYLRYRMKFHPRLSEGAAPHRALSDAIVCAEFLILALYEVRKRWPEIKTVRQLIDKIEGPALLDRVPFKSAEGVRFVDADYGLLRWIIDKQAGGADVIFTAEHELNRRYQSVYSESPTLGNMADEENEPQDGLPF